MKRNLLTRLTLTASTAALVLGAVACEVEGDGADPALEDPALEDPALEDGADEGVDDDM